MCSDSQLKAEVKTRSIKSFYMKYLFVVQILISTVEEIAVWKDAMSVQYMS